MENEEYDGLLDIAIDWLSAIEPEQRAMVDYLQKHADKQGYMRGLEEIQEWANATHKDTKKTEGCMFETGPFCEHAIGWNDALIHGLGDFISQAHDAISKLKENV